MYINNKPIVKKHSLVSYAVRYILYLIAGAVFIDTEYETWNMDPVALEKAFEQYPDVKLIVFAHLYGTPAKVDEIRAIADKHGALIKCSLRLVKIGTSWKFC